MRTWFFWVIVQAYTPVSAPNLAASRIVDLRTFATEAECNQARAEKTIGLIESCQRRERSEGNAKMDDRNPL